MSATTVANKYVLDREYPGWIIDELYEYIGRRPSGMHFGNPFPLTKYTRQESIQAFENWLDGTMYQQVEPERRQWVLDNMGSLQGKTLVCFCHPQDCHGGIYRLRLDRD